MAKIIFENKHIVGYDTMAEVVLSRRNLLTLLTKLYTEGSAKTIVNNIIVDQNDQLLMKPDVHFAVRAESDEDHYERRAPAGPMHPLTEALIHLLEIITQTELPEVLPNGNFIYHVELPKEAYEIIQRGI